ncbi:Chromate resistance protein ChrB [Nocardioides sp.]|uniref:Chromate resistance protein ChrB n=1 Tax=Nocardioides sp. TaxID=35761 RepID=UPI00273539D1|nr:Chromate resistance protein ChrB [Nocardioides sp.]MDP3893602.1 chromate resistance protein [Nocardioides sp.]
MLLTYRLPREPSTPRASVWRKLRRLGVAQLADGLVALPEDARTREQLEWIAEEVTGAGGSAMLWHAQPTALGDERAVAQTMSVERTREYDDLAARAVSALSGSPAELRRALKSLRSELRAVRRRDYFRASGREAAVAAIDALALAVAEAAAEAAVIQ